VSGALLPIFFLALLAACGGEPEAAPPPPPPVKVVTVEGRAVANIVELPGRIEAVRSAQVRARTDGIVERRLYQEGTDVKAGQPLFLIDPRDKRAALQQAQAALQGAEAARANAQRIADRYKPLVAERAVSAQEYDSALAALRQAEASVADAKAAIARAELELEYTTVRAPIAGRAGQALVTEGALVSAAAATIMTNVEQMNPIYAVFTQSNAAARSLQRQVDSGEVKLGSLDRVEVRLVLEDGSEYAPIGYLDFASQSVDPSTGSQVIRARFPNIDRVLLPGQFVRGRVAAGTLPQGLVVPQRAIQISNEEANVFTLSPDNVVVQKTVELGGLVGSGWVIRSGLKAGDRVITEGWQKVGPGQTVTPTEEGADEAAPAAAKAPVDAKAAAAAGR